MLLRIVEVQRFPKHVKSHLTEEKDKVLQRKRQNLLWILKILEELVGYHKQKRECILGKEVGTEGKW